MNLIMKLFQHNFNIHMDHISDSGIHINGSTFNCNNIGFKCWKIETYNVMNKDEAWILRKCNTAAPNVILHNHMQHTQL